MWDPKKTLKENYAAAGLAYDPNEVVNSTTQNLVAKGILPDPEEAELEEIMGHELPVARGTKKLLEKLDVRFSSSFFHAGFDAIFELLNGIFVLEFSNSIDFMHEERLQLEKCIFLAHSGVIFIHYFGKLMFICTFLSKYRLIFCTLNLCASCRCSISFR
jgi:hypothetical protein